jgi:uncharacterized protein
MDMAFVVMDLLFEGRPDLARTFAEAYFQAASDEEGRALLPMYTAYRSTVRAKVGGIKCAEAEIAENERAVACTRVRAHWLMALGEVEKAERKPCLVLIGGLPGSGKSTLARGLAERAAFRVLRTDLVRKELARQAGFDLELSRRPDIYSQEWTAKTYAECLRRAEEMLLAGERVLVDATFREESWRRAFLESAARLRLPAVLLLCRVASAVARARLEYRRHDVSDADWQVYLSLAQNWQELGDYSQRFTREIDSERKEAETIAQGIHALEMLGCLGAKDEPSV